MGTLETFLYGFLQGATEFIPVSSSGHLALLPYLLKFKDPGVIFDLAMHVGTALAIVLYFRKEVKKILISSWSILLTRKISGPDQALSANMITATLVTGILALALKEFAFQYGRSPQLIAFNLAFFGILMALADRRPLYETTPLMDRVQWKKSFWIGLFQVVAIFPGVSRSGATLTISRFLGLSREEGSRFSFLLSLPLIFAGTILEFCQLSKDDMHFQLADLFWGVSLSFIVGLLTIHYFLKWVPKIGLMPFTVYRLALAFFLCFIIYF